MRMERQGLGAEEELGHGAGAGWVDRELLSRSGVEEALCLGKRMGGQARGGWASAAGRQSLGRVQGRLEGGGL